MNYGPPENLDILKKQIKDREIDVKSGEGLPLVILLKKTDEFIGRFALEGIDQKTPEMGGWLKQSAQGSGYGTEVAAALKHWADENLDYDYILWPCAVENKASCKLAESLGGKIHRKYIKKNARGKTWDFLEYRIFKSS